MKQRQVSQSQLVLPLLESMDEAGGRVTTKALYDLVSNKIDVADDVRNHRIDCGNAHEINTFEREVRWAQQRAKLMGLIEKDSDTFWRITQKGKDALTKATPGLVITVFTTDKGVALWASCDDGVGMIDDGSLQLIFSSPPYPLLREKAYGNRAANEYVDWLLRLVEKWPRKLTRDGSIVLNLADVFERGQPTLSLYQERLLIRLEDELGLKLCQRFAWQNPSKMPAPAEWVTVRRVRVKPGLEQLYWLSPNGNPYADNRQVLKPYSGSMLDRIKAGGEQGAERPSGHAIAAGAFGKNNGGAIPDNLIVAANTESNSEYIRLCKENGLPVHPARFPAALASFFIRMLTREGDTVWDPFGGSGTTAKEAEKLKRFWITTEMMREYVEGMRLRFFPSSATPQLAF